LQLHRKGRVAVALAVVFAVVFVFWLSSFAEGGGSAVVVAVVVVDIAFVIAVATGNPNAPPSAFQPQKKKWL
jgi:hypothetical protein